MGMVGPSLRLYLKKGKNVKTNGKDREEREKGTVIL